MHEDISTHDQSAAIPAPAAHPRLPAQEYGVRARLFPSVTVWLIWPGLLALCIFMMAALSVHWSAFAAFNAAYFVLILSLFALERVIPHEKAWNENDGQIFADIGHTLLTKGVVQGVLLFGGVIGLSDYISSLSGAPPQHWPLTLWPRAWPIWGQIMLALVVAEFMLYWAHRIAHEWRPLWRFHAVHHSVKRLWIVNTGRFHFIDSLISVVLGSSVVLLLGAPMEIIIWLSAITAFIGMLTHCNVRMRFGPLSYVFNTPGLHRWHHSKKLPEGNSNYGENLMIWDLVFRTFHNPDKHPPRDVGITEYMPENFSDQLLYPFRPGYYETIGIEKGIMPPRPGWKITRKRDPGFQTFARKLQKIRTLQRKGGEDQVGDADNHHPVRH